MIKASCLLRFLPHSLSSALPGGVEQRGRHRPRAGRAEGSGSTKVPRQGWLPAQPPRPGQTDTGGCSQLEGLLGFRTDRWFPSQCLRPAPSTASHGLRTVPRVLPAGSWLKSSTSSGRGPSAEQGVPGQSRGPGSPGSVSSNTGLSKRPSRSAHSAAHAIPVRASGQGLQSTAQLGASHWPQCGA